MNNDVKPLPVPRWLPWSLAVASLALTACFVRVPDGVETVSDFELDRYLGTWYEVARLDHRFERGLSNVTANYVLGEEGEVVVTNRGWKDEAGEWKQSVGRAVFVGDESVGQLKVSFFGPFYGGYNIMALDAAADDYRYALVAGPNKGNLWLLSRTPSMDTELRGELVARARAAGFAVDELIWVEQDRHTAP